MVCACAAAVVLLVSGCGGARQDAQEPKGTFTMRVVRARFPAVQPIARQTQFELWVRNTGTATVPTVAVTIDSFYFTLTTPPELAANKRPVWVVESGPGAIPKLPVESQAVSPPGGGQTAYINTWALGPLAPGRTRRFVWKVVPVKPGVHSVRYTVAAGLSGRALARTSTGLPLGGRFATLITRAPPPTHVNPNTGQVEPGRYPLQP